MTRRNVSLHPEHRLTSLHEQPAEAVKLDAAIAANVLVCRSDNEGRKELGYGGDWRETTLGQVTDFLSGGTPSKGVCSYWDGTVPWVSAKDMKRFCIDDTEDHVTEAGVQIGAKLVPSDTVLLLARGMTLLNDVPICVVKRPMTFNQDVKALRPKSGVRNDFLPYLLLGNKGRLLSLVDLAGHGTGRLNSDELKALDVVLPPKPEQRAIAHILGTLDDKIELNRRMNETLEAMARALFKSWFIDFDPVRRNMARKAGQNQPSPPVPLPEGDGCKPNYRGGYDFSGLLETARALRRKQTPAEDMFWELVRDRRFLGLKFRRQHQLGDYIADFYCHEHRLVIELDGGIHARKKKKDTKRDNWMIAQSLTELRFTNEQLLDAPQVVLETMAMSLSTLTGKAGDEGLLETNGSSTSGRGGGEGTIQSGGSSPFGRGGGEGGIEALDALFPDSFEDSELGEIPKGWEVCGLDQIARFLNGLALQKFPPKNGLSLPVIKIAQLRTGDTAGADAANAELDPDYVVEDGNVLFSWSGSLECVLWTGGRGALNQHLFKVTSGEFPKWFYYLWIHQHLANFRHIADGKATTMGHIQRHHLSDARVVIPAGNTLKIANDVLSPLIDKIIETRIESRTLASLRDTLLPKLISGDLCVKDLNVFNRRNV